MDNIIIKPTEEQIYNAYIAYLQKIRKPEPEQFAKESVDALADFIIKAVQECKAIICQCEYGQSRSAACAAAIKEYIDRTGIDIFSDYKYYPNQLVYNKIFAALKSKTQ